MKMGIIIVLILLTGVALSSPTTAQQQVQDLQLVEQIGGSTYAVAVQGNYAYVGVGPRLVILDISDPTHPHVIGKTEVLHDLVMDVAILGRYAYIANSHSGLGVIDISNPAHPTEVGFYDTPDYALDVAVSGTYAYVANGDGGLRIIDISNPAHPTGVGFYDTSGHAWGVAVSGTYAYVADGDGGLRIIDVSNPAHPIEIGFYGAKALGVTVTENYVYIAAGDHGLRIIDVTNPTNPREIGFYSAPCFQLEVSGAHVYAITGGTLDIIDITNPSTPRRIGFYEGLGGYGRRVAVWGSYVYVAVMYSNLWIIDVANPTQPTKVGHYTLGSGFHKVEVLGNYAYILGEPGRWLGELWGYKLYVADVTNPDRLNMTYAYDLWARDVALSEHYAYLAEAVSELLVIDISNPALPTVGGAPTEGASMAVAVAQDYAYVASQYAYPYLDIFLNVIDISDPTHPRRVSYCLIGVGRVDEVVVVGNTAYVTDWYSGGIHIVDVSDPIYPREVAFFPTGDPKGIAVADNYLYLATGEGGLRIINISDPLHPQEVGANDTVYAQSVAVLGTYAYVGMASRGLAVIDVSDPTHPRVVDTSEKAKAWNVAVSGGYIYTAADEFGLFVLRHSLLASGIVRGKVIDVSTNKGIAGALVDANNGDRSYTTTTDAGGNYTLSLPPGTYELTASASGYQSETKEGVEVAAGQTVIVDFALSSEAHGPPTVTLKAATYFPAVHGETITIIVEDPRYPGGISGHRVLVLEHSVLGELMHWDALYPVDALPPQVEFKLPNLPEGEIIARYTDPADSSRQASASAQVTTSWHFAIITDLHIGRDYKDYAGEDYYLTQRLQTIVQWLNDNARSRIIKLLLVLGDISDSGKEAELQKAKEILNTLTIPYVPLLGNHDDDQGDRGANFRTVFGEYLRNSSLHKVVSDFITDDDPDLENYAFDCGGIRFILLDWTPRVPVYAIWAIAHDKTLQWLSSNLVRTMPIVLLSHHPLAANLVAAFPPPKLRLIESILRPYRNVIWSFAGHIHGFDAPHAFNMRWGSANRRYKDLLGRIPVETTEAVMVGPNSPNLDRRVVRMVQVENGRITRSYLENGGVDYALNPRIEGDFPTFEAKLYTRWGNLRLRWEFTHAGRTLTKEGNPVTLFYADIAQLFEGEFGTHHLHVTLIAEYGAYTERITRTIPLSITTALWADFQNLEGWEAGGLWHLRSEGCVNHERFEGSFAYYAQPNGCTYEVNDQRGRSVRTQGTLTSPIITISKNASLSINFDFFREVERNTRSTLDRTYVQIRLGTSGRTIRWDSWRTIWSRSSRDPSPEDGTATLNFNSSRYDRLQIRFIFDSVNGNNNNYRGWAIDNLVVQSASASTTSLGEADLGIGWDVPEELEPGEVTIRSILNAAGNEHTIVFTVLGVEAKAIKAEVYDLTGRLVWLGEGEGNELSWDTRGLSGVPLANGVYLYVVRVRGFDDREYVSEVRKLVILR